MVTRRPGPDLEGQTIGGFLDSIIAKRPPGDKTKASDHLSNRQRISLWLDSLPLTEPMRAKDATFALLLEQDGLRLPFTVERTDALFQLDRSTQPSLIKLESDYLAAKPGGELESLLWRACSDLGRAFIVTYERAFTDNVERLGSRAALQAVTLVLARIVHFLAWQARLAAYRRSEWIPGRWQQLHRIYRKARAFGVQTHEVPDLSDPVRQRRTTVESEYVSLLLMWRLASGTLSRTEIAQAYYWLRDRPRHALFVGAHRPGTRLGVDPTQPEGLKPLAHLGHIQEKFLFDSTLLADPLNGTLSRLEDRLGAKPTANEARKLRQQIELVQYLITHWVVVGFTDRAERTKVDRRVEFAAGWPAIEAKLLAFERAQQQAARAHAEPARPPIAGARPGPQATLSAVRRGWANAAGDSSDLWIIRDQSVSGCRVVSPSGKSAGLKVGDAIALHDPLNGQWDVGLVRRWRFAGDERIEIGLLWFARNAQPLKLYPVAEAGRAETAKPMHGLGGAPEGGDGEFMLALLPVAFLALQSRTWEQSAPRGKLVLATEAVELPGTDWCWVKLRVTAREAGIAGQREAEPANDDVTEIEITPPRE